MNNLFYGNKFLQKFWKLMLRISLKGLNHNRGHVPNANGEVFTVRHVLKNIPGNSPVIFDVGANKGQYLSMFLNQIPSGLNVRIHCFEPQKKAFAKLKEVANVQTGIFLNNFALGSRKDEILLYSNNEESEYGSLYPADYFHLDIKLSNKETIRIDTLDNYCNENNITEIDFLKIDVEGHELEVLKGANNLLSTGKIKFIQFEFGLASIEARIFFKDFVVFLNDYDIYRILPKGLELIQYSEYCEIFFVTNYLAVRKNN